MRQEKEKKSIGRPASNSLPHRFSEDETPSRELEGVGSVSGQHDFLWRRGLRMFSFIFWPIEGGLHFDMKKLNKANSGKVDADVSATHGFWLHAANREV